MPKNQLKPIKHAADKNGVYYDAQLKQGCHMFTVLFKQPWMGRGEYGDEIDVWANTSTHAKRIALSVIEAEYEPDCVPARTYVRQMSVYWRKKD